MGENSEIAWTNHTFNPWIGCTKVADGCKHCYAEAQQAGRFGRVVWGPNGTRRVTREENWNKVRRLDAEAFRAGRRDRVFCASLADVFEAWGGLMLNTKNEALRICGRCGHWATSRHCSRCWGDGRSEVLRNLTLDDVRAKLFTLIDATAATDWLLLTKRPERIREAWPAIVERAALHFFDEADQRARGLSGPGPHVGELVRGNSRRENVWLGTSIAHQADLVRVIRHLAAVADLAPVRFLSAEPLLGPLEFGDVDGFNTFGDVRVDPGPDGVGVETPVEPAANWVILGGESGPDARECRVEWIRDAVNECQFYGVPVFVKQLGSHATFEGRRLTLKHPKGGDPDEWPAPLRVRQFPGKAGA